MSHPGDVAPPSERAFGKTFAGLFAVIAAWGAFTGRPMVLAGFAAASAAMALVTVARPSLLAAPNRLWFRLGLLLHRVVSPIVLGAMYFLVVTPVALVIRLVGRDVLDRHWDPKARTYWKERDPPGPDDDDSFNQQF